MRHLVDTQVDGRSRREVGAGANSSSLARPSTSGSPAFRLYDCSAAFPPLFSVAEYELQFYDSAMR